MKILCVNAGSSSLKFQLFEMPEEKVLVQGLIERIGMQDAVVTLKYDGQKKSKTLPILNHAVAVEILLNSLVEEKIVASLNEINSTEEFGNIFSAVPKVCEKLGIKEDRTVVNTGASAGQTVFHIHVHVMAGREFGWPAG